MNPCIRLLAAVGLATVTTAISADMAWGADTIQAEGTFKYSRQEATRRVEGTYTARLQFAVDERGYNVGAPSGTIECEDVTMYTDSSKPGQWFPDKYYRTDKVVSGNLNPDGSFELRADRSWRRELQNYWKKPGDLDRTSGQSVEMLQGKFDLAAGTGVLLMHIPLESTNGQIPLTVTRQLGPRPATPTPVPVNQEGVPTVPAPEEEEPVVTEAEAPAPPTAIRPTITGSVNVTGVTQPVAMSGVSVHLRFSDGAEAVVDTRRDGTFEMEWPESMLGRDTMAVEITGLELPEGDPVLRLTTGIFYPMRTSLTVTRDGSANLDLEIPTGAVVFTADWEGAQAREALIQVGDGPAFQFRIKKDAFNSVRFLAKRGDPALDTLRLQNGAGLNLQEKVSALVDFTYDGGTTLKNGCGWLEFPTPDQTMDATMRIPPLSQREPECETD